MPEMTTLEIRIYRCAPRTGLKNLNHLKHLLSLEGRNCRTDHADFVLVSASDDWRWPVITSCAVTCSASDSEGRLMQLRLALVPGVDGNQDPPVEEAVRF